MAVKTASAVRKIPFPLTMSEESLARDIEFDEMLQQGLDEAKRNQSRLAREVFEDLLVDQMFLNGMR